MSWNLDLHRCKEQDDCKSNPHAAKWDIDERWFGFSLAHGGEDVRIVYCPWCGKKLIRKRDNGNARESQG